MIELPLSHFHDAPFHGSRWVCAPPGGGKKQAKDKPKTLIQWRSSPFRRAGFVLALSVATLLFAVHASYALQQIALAWDPNPAPDIAGYRLYYGLASRVYTQQIDLGNISAISVSNLVEGKKYFFAVTDYNTAALESAPSNEVSYTVPTSGATPTPTPTPNPIPLAPSNLVARAPRSIEIDLSWTDNSNNETGFKIERSTNGVTFTQIAIVSGNTFVNVGLTPSTKYYYRVRAYNSAGNSAYSNMGSTTTPPSPTPTPTPTGMPSAPSNLVANAPWSTEIDLSWTDNSNNETGFKIERSTNGVTFTQIATASGSTRFVNIGLTPSTKYYYRVRAYNSVGNSAYSNRASATTPGSLASTSTATQSPSSTDQTSSGSGPTYIFTSGGSQNNTSASSLTGSATFAASRTLSSSATQ